MNPSAGCVTCPYPPATKKYISDVRCTCPHCGNILTGEEMKENVMLYARDSRINEMRRSQGQGLKSYECQSYSRKVMANNVILPLSVTLWSRGKIKAIFY